MLGDHSSYHQSIQGDEAEKRLKESHTHCYLTRFSDRGDCYVLSVYMQQTPIDVMKHFKIIIKDDSKVLIEGKDEEFDNIGLLLHNYEQKRIDPALPTIGKNCVEKEYKDRKEREVREQKEQGDREARGQREEREREEREQRDREAREEREQKDREEKERRDREEKERRDKEKEQKDKEERDQRDREERDRREGEERERREREEREQRNRERRRCTIL